MTSPEQQPAPEPDPRDEAEEQPRSEELPAPDESQLVGKPQPDADVPDTPLPLAPDETALPESDRAPGVLREIPVGGKLPLDAPEPALDAAPDTPTAAPVRDMPAPEDLATTQPEPETPPAPEQEPLPPSAEAEEAVSPAEEAMDAAAIDEMVSEGAPVEAPAETPIETPVEAPTEPPAETPGVASAETPAETPEAEEDATPAAGITRPVETSVPAEYEAAPTPAPSTASIARAEDWDDEISPELAAILFGGASAAATQEPEAPAPAAATAEEAPAPAAAPAAAPAPAVKPRLDEPIMVTTADEARSQPIRAGQLSAPPPGAPVKGTYRYMRVEEPMRGEQGRRIEERWEYFGPDYPALEGLLVKRVEIEEFSYADGSWKLTFRRDYSQGRDERTVRISGDGEYAERTDRIRRPDAMSGKTIREREHVCLRYAAPVQEEKRGFLAGLFKRGNGPKAEGAKRWREATDSERRDARQNGGRAFKLGLFEKP